MTVNCFIFAWYSYSVIINSSFDNIIPFYWSQRIQYAKTKSDVIAKADGTFVPREKRKKHDDKGGKKRKGQHDANQAAVGVNPSYAGAYGAPPPVSLFHLINLETDIIFFIGFVNTHFFTFGAVITNTIRGWC